MPIKAKRIDPERARLAARGQWQPQQQKGAARRTLPINKPQHQRRAGSSSSTSSSSSDESSQSRRGRRPVGNCAKPTGNNNVRVAAAFMTAPQVRECESETSNSDAELYRAARERTAQFLYPNGRPANNRNVSSSTVAKEEAGGGGVTTSTEGTTRQDLPLAATDHRPPYAIPGDETQGEWMRKDGDRRINGGTATAVDDDIGSSVPSRTAPPLVVQEALHGMGNVKRSASQREFAHLLDLLANDDHKEQKPELEDAKVGSESSLLIENANREKQQHLSERSKTYVCPPRTFAELQERTLLELYAAHGEEKDDEYFIATDHTAEAFTLAALEAARESRALKNHTDPLALAAPISSISKSGDDSGGGGGGGGSGCLSGSTYGAPLSLMEIVTAERARRNALAALEERHERGVGEVSIDTNTEAILAADAGVLASAAEESLNRFLSGARCIEMAVRDRRVTDELGRFLFQEHKLFLRAGTGDTGDASNSDAVREFPHEALAVYERYSRYVSNFLLGLLKRRVPGFNVEEFVLTLYDVNNEDNEDDLEVGRSNTMDVLSYPAWRLLQSISSFNEFCAFMDDFIAEEYGVEKVETHDDGKVGAKKLSDSADDVVVVAGARGIRALLGKASTMKRDIEQDDLAPANRDADGNGDVDSSISAVVPRGSSDDVVQTQEENQTSHSTVDQPSRADSTSNLVRSSFTASAPLCRAPLAQTPTPPPPVPLISSQRSSHSSITSFSHLPPGRRRPDAVPGRKLPPLPVTEGGDGEVVFSTVQPKLRQKSVVAGAPAGSSGAVPVTRGRSGKRTVGGGGGGSGNDTKVPSERTPSTTAGSGHRGKSNGGEGGRSRSGARKGPASVGVATSTRSGGRPVKPS
ncbi:hypothetical protein DQ04_01541010 [Trypanosoma grayi]|uniref:hypothetical protein n=1 Tax=Trypanosoma grayi TaxID=71804 RepID=UPI0004F42942|nr:hypothetical protein DQ04_01541010 [Trypanosoma grayi]KEG12661.1 hypothetical protein DQ04_01541010 [Trypanosoma grayi]